MSKLLVGVSVLAVLVPHAARAQVPSLTGAVDVDLPRGAITGDLCLHEPPLHEDTVWFVLHHGLNVKRIRSSGGEMLPHHTEAALDGVGLRYAVAYAASSAAPPEADGTRTVCVEYTGAFPVYDVHAGDYRPSDVSSVVAFNGRTLRARGETRWYPTPYDPATDQLHAHLAYQLNVRCPACRYLYVNGAPLHQGPEANLRSDVPGEPLLFVGDYPVYEIDGVSFLGEVVSADTARLFVQRLMEVQGFYEAFIGLPFGPSVDVLRIIPVRYDRPGQFWGFFADPALGLVGLTLGEFVQILSDSKHGAQPVVLGVLAHELAHRYFPGVLAPGGPYYQLFSEPFASYLDVKATRHFHGEEAYHEQIRAIGQRARTGPDLPSLDRVSPRQLADDRYRYGYAPLLLLTLEREVGEPHMRALLRALLTAPPAERSRADYAFMRRIALRSGIPEAAWQRWEERCVRAPLSQSDCLRELLEEPAA